MKKKNNKYLLKIRNYKFIVVSKNILLYNYDNFDYFKHMLKLNVSNYIYIYLKKWRIARKYLLFKKGIRKNGINIRHRIRIKVIINYFLN